MELCIFCRNERTKHRGEHVWDDWLNKVSGKRVRMPGSTTHTGANGQSVRSYPSTGLDVTADVVCDRCNHEWMSALSSKTKDILEPSIRFGAPVKLDALGVVTIASFAFLKAAILDWSSTADGRTPCIPRWACKAFRNSLAATFTGYIAIPRGTHIWISRYRRTQVVEASAHVEEMHTDGTPFEGYRILVITYVINAFIFQFLFPAWDGPARRVRRRSLTFEMQNDRLSVPLWPNVASANWPPPSDVSSGSLDSFRQRFRKARYPIRRRLPQ